MNEEEFKKFIKHKELGVSILSVIYIGLILVIYLTVFLYINELKNSEQDVYQSIIPLIITSVIGGYSKGFYFSLVDLIFDNEEKLVTEKVKKSNRKIEGMINFITIMLLVTFLISINTYESPLLTVAIIAIYSLISLLVVGMYFKFTPFTVEELRKKK